MPVTSGSQSLLASLPPFMSVFGGDIRASDAVASTTSPTPIAPSSYGASRTQHIGHRRPSSSTNLATSLYRRNSGTTIRTESTDSSPTTTISTVDSTLTEPSPSSSPESPSSTLPIALHPSKGYTPSGMDHDLFRSSFVSSPSPNRPGFGRSDSPNKRPRNTKNLQVNTAGANRPLASHPLPRAVPSDPLAVTESGQPFSAPTSPSFVKPPIPKRKQSNLALSITTSEANPKAPVSRSLADMVPPTPAFAQPSRARHLDPHAAQPLFSPMGAPAGGMQLPPFGPSNPHPSARARPPIPFPPPSFLDNLTSPIVAQTLDHVPEEADHDLPLSREVKSPAYPDGPVCIYPPNVFLYLEPNDFEASNFDVVINVAREVLNPFDAAEAPPAEEPKTKDIGVQVNLIGEPLSQLRRGPIAEPPTAISEKSFASAFGSLATAKAAKPKPEYIHVPWEHNTKVSVELLRLCELIDDRVQHGKRVLVHCQCGVSRSASLIIAYGLYKNPELSHNEAYEAVKDRSRWINPNMHFIFEIHAFKQMLLERRPHPALGRRPGLPSALTRSQTESVLSVTAASPSSMPIDDDEPATAPFDGPKAHRSSSVHHPPTTTALADMLSDGDVTPGPSDEMRCSSPVTAPPLPFKSLHRGAGDEPRPAVSLAPPPMAHRNAPISTIDRPAEYAVENPEPLPAPNLPWSRSTPTLRSMPSLPGGFSTLLSRRQGLAQLPLHSVASPGLPTARPLHIPIQSALVSDAVPHAPSLLSPRAAEFTTSPFHRTTAGDLAGSSVYEQGLMGPRETENDPRSPPMRGEAPITRSIDDVL